MKKIKLKHLTVAWLLASMSLLADAAGLGKLNVFSALGEPLQAEIDVLATSADELETLTASLASEDIYAEQGVDRSAIQSNIKTTVIKKSDGQAIIKLSTDMAVVDSFLDMIVMLSWKDGELFREYTLLLDPPGYSGTAVSAPTVNIPKSIAKKDELSASLESKVKKSHAAAIASNAKPEAESSLADASQSIVTKKGDTLSAIAKRLQMDDVNLDQMLIGLYNANKSAFEGGNINRLRVGKNLQIPSLDALQSVSPLEAQQQVRAQANDWQEYTNKLADLVAKSEPVGNESNLTNTGKIVAKADDKKLAAEAGARDVVKLSKSDADKASSTLAQQDDLVAKQNAIKESDEKAAALSKQIADMKALLAIKNKAMAEAQNADVTKPVVAEEAKPEVKKEADPIQADQKFNFLTLINSFILPIAGGLLALMVALLIWVSRKNKAKINALATLENDMADGTSQLPSGGSSAFMTNISSANRAMVDVSMGGSSAVDPIAEADVSLLDSRQEQAVDILDDAMPMSPTPVAPQAASLNLADISLEFEPLIASEPVVAAPPIPDAFSGDFSNLLKIHPAPVNNISNQATPTPGATEVDTKIELAAAYIDMADKKGAMKLLNEAMAEGNQSQKVRAQGLIDKLA